MSEGNAISFNYLGSTLEIAPFLLTYNEVRLSYQELGNRIVANFIEDYKGFGDPATFHSKCDNCAIDYIQTALDFIVSQLIKNGIYDMTADRIIQLHGHKFLSGWLDAFDSVNDRYLQLNHTEQEVNQFRKERRQNRGRFIGGGFGLRGAAKGIATAGALNMASGALHGVVNIMGNITTSIATSVAARKIYRDPETLETLYNGLFLTVFSLHEIHCDILKISIPTFDNSKVEAILRNLSRIPNKDRVSVLIDCILANPYNPDIYIKSVDLYGDKDGSVQHIADIFGITELLESHKISLLRNGIDLPSISTLAIAKQVQNTIAQKSLYLNVYDDELEYGINHLIQQLDEENRTFDNVIYPSIETRNQAEEEYISCNLEALLSDIDSLSATQLNRLIYTLKGMRHYNGNSHLTKLVKLHKKKAISEAYNMVDSCTSAESFLSFKSHWHDLGMNTEDDLPTLMTYASETFMKKFRDVITKDDTYKKNGLGMWHWITALVITSPSFFLCILVTLNHTMDFGFFGKSFLAFGLFLFFGTPLVSS